ncbi:unnamed protein product [Lactuca virosa]|uniref:Uncharacterized protein n=1 Tax=Lactuca virosa TaxID=75947 RepID=A0AAU9N9X7_9ASTR|nr:unnamed protein product [Lactuca virosa]
MTLHYNTSSRIECTDSYPQQIKRLKYSISPLPFRLPPTLPNTIVSHPCPKSLIATSFAIDLLQAPNCCRSDIATSPPLPPGTTCCRALPIHLRIRIRGVDEKSEKSC